MKKIFTALIILDGILTFWATNNGYVEVNPLMAPIAHTALYPILKVITVILGVVIVAALVKRFPQLKRVATLGYASCIVFYVLVLASNTMELIL